jgi:WhiB family transcriptional regulator, redox-sensing transcriptional regulator
MRSLRVAASWQQGIPEPGQDPNAAAWRFLAACADYDPDLFFPIGTSGPALRQAERAKAVCAGCPVRAECLDWAQTTGQTYGVWGGLDEHEREALDDHRDGHDLHSNGEILPVARPA